jgi:hypothetical protein
MMMGTLWDDTEDVLNALKSLSLIENSSTCAPKCTQDVHADGYPLTWHGRMLELIEVINPDRLGARQILMLMGTLWDGTEELLNSSKSLLLNLKPTRLRPSARQTLMLRGTLWGYTGEVLHLLKSSILIVKPPRLRPSAHHILMMMGTLLG